MSALDEEVYRKRVEKIRKEMQKNSINGYLIFSNLGINYVTGYNFIPTERPAALFITDTSVDIVVPLLEENAAEQKNLINEVYTYYDYPGNNKGHYYGHNSRSPEEMIRKMVEKRDVQNIGCDMNGAPSVNGYEGPSLEQILDEKVLVEEWTENMRLQKSEDEVEILSQSAEYSDQAFEMIRDEIKPGRNEVSLNLEMKKKTTEMVLKDQGSLSVGSGELAYFRILSGPNTYNPHGKVENREIQEKDILLPGMALAYSGYNAELERTMFMGEPTDQQRNYFEIMREAQQIAEDNGAAGVKLSKVDQEVHDYFKEQGVLEYARHHTGHGLGLQGHEKPFIDRGNDRELKRNMVISLEPGIYVPEAGGFRHSDTYLVEENGLRRLTSDPRDLESNIL